MERAIRRGQLLREVLKQDRLERFPAVFQLGWLIAFNEGFLNDGSPEGVAGQLAALQQKLATSSLTLDSPREDWLRHLAAWLQTTAEMP